MNEYHTYPISEDQARKLDDLTTTAQAEWRGRARRADQWVRSNATMAASVALLLGFIIGRAVKS